jgi:hypothetical protein
VDRVHGRGAGAGFANLQQGCRDQTATAGSPTGLPFRNWAAPPLEPLPQRSAAAVRCRATGQRSDSGKDSSWWAIDRCNPRRISALASFCPGFHRQERDRSSITGGSLRSCSRPTGARLLELSGYAGSASLRFPLVIFMFVKKASNLLLQHRRLARLAHGHGVFEKLSLDARGQIIPL